MEENHSVRKDNCGFIFNNFPAKGRNSIQRRLFFGSWKEGREVPLLTINLKYLNIIFKLGRVTADEIW